MSRSELETNFFSNSTLENKHKYKKQIYIYRNRKKEKKTVANFIKKRRESSNKILIKKRKTMRFF